MLGTQSHPLAVKSVERVGVRSELRWSVQNVSRAGQEIHPFIAKLSATNSWCFTGFFAIPGALTPAEQQQLAIDALTRFPVYPATTNLTAQYGHLPGSLWQAAEEGLFLESTELATSPASSLSLSSTGSRASLQVSHDRRATATAESAAPEEPARGPDSSAQPAGCANGLHSDRVRAPCGRQSVAPCAAQSTLKACLHTGVDHQHTAAPQSADALHQCWSRRGTGPAARDLLLSLRWATLGLPYDWTARSYDHGAPQRPIPQYLKDIAARLVRWAQATQHTQCPHGLSDREAGRHNEDGCHAEFAPPGDATALLGMDTVNIQYSP